MHHVVDGLDLIRKVSEGIGLLQVIRGAEELVLAADAAGKGEGAAVARRSPAPDARRR